MEENNEEIKQAIDIELTEQKADLENDKNAIDFRWSDEQMEDQEDIAQTHLIESLHKQANEKNYRK